MTRAAATLVVLMLGCVASGFSSGAVASAEPQQSAFVCPMHPEVQSAVAGTCSKCGMALLPTSPPNVSAYALELRTVPAAVTPGRPFQLLLTVRDATGALVKEFVEVHERRFHLFVISHDLEHYAHVHPEQRGDGSWSVDVTVPASGHYKLYADFLPEGGTPQALALPLVTAGAVVAPPAAASLTPDDILHKTLESMRVSLELPEGGLVAGREATFTYMLTDAATRRPVTDIEPYLGAWGHSLLVSADLSHVVHAHPLESLHHGTNGAGGGPTLTFKARLPEAGKYRIWTQVKRDGEISTVVFTVPVLPGDGQGRSTSSGNGDPHVHRHERSR